MPLPRINAVTDIRATDAPGPRVVATITEFTVDGDTYLGLRVDEPLTAETALALAEHLTNAAKSLAA